MKLVSIIMPVYNAEKYVERALDALRKQSYTNIEVLAINDGSKDSSLSILKKHAEIDPRIVIIDQPNSGPAKSRNNGLDKARGDYIMFCDADDWYNPNMVERMVSEIETTGVDMVWCSFDIIIEGSAWNAPPRLRYLSFVLKFPEAIRYGNVVMTNSVMLWDKIFRKSVIDKFNIRFPDGHEHDDDAFCHQYNFASDKRHFLNERLYNYIVRGEGSITASYDMKMPKNKWDRVYMNETLARFLRKHKLLTTDNAFIIGHIISNNWGYLDFIYDRREIHHTWRRMNALLRGSPLILLREGGNLILMDTRDLWWGGLAWLNIKATFLGWTRRLWRGNYKSEPTEKFMERLDKKT